MEAAKNNYYESSNKTYKIKKVFLSPMGNSVKSSDMQTGF